TRVGWTRLNERFRIDLPQLRGVGHALEARTRDEPLAGRLGGVARLVRFPQPGEIHGRRALRDRAVKEPLRRRRNHQAPNAYAPRRLPEDRHAIRIAAERRDIPPDPAQAFNLVEKSVIA